MNISDVNNKIYGYKNLKEGEYMNFIMKSIEEKEIINLNQNIQKNNENNNGFYGINKEIKF